MSYLTLKEVEEKVDKADFTEVWAEETYEDIKNFIHQQRIQDLESVEKMMKGTVECLEEAIILMEGVVEGTYEPDNFTTQPWEYALNALKHRQQLLQALKK